LLKGLGIIVLSHAFEKVMTRVPEQAMGINHEPLRMARTAMPLFIFLTGPRGLSTAVPYKRFSSVFCM
jgi:hypothetical protein